MPDESPITSRSIRGAEVQDSAPRVSIAPAPLSMPVSSRVPVFRVAQWMQRVASGKLDMGQGGTAIHAALLIAVAQYQGYNALCEATAKTLGRAALTSESAARDALAELVAGKWLTRHDRKRDDCHWFESLYSIATEPGQPIPARPRKSKGVPPETRCVPPDSTPDAAPPCTATRSEVYRQAGDPVPPEPNKKTIQKIIEKTIAPAAPAHASARARGSRLKSKDGMLFEMPNVEPATPAKAQPEAKRKPEKTETENRYSVMYVGGQTDAEPECGFTPLSAAECRLLGIAAAAHARANGERIVGEALLAWIRKTSVEYRRAAEPAYAKGFRVHGFVTWLDSGRPVTRKAPLPAPRTEPRFKIPLVLPPPPKPRDHAAQRAKQDAYSARMAAEFEAREAAKQTAAESHEAQ